MARSCKGIFLLLSFARKDQILHVKGDQAVLSPFMSSLILWYQQAAGAPRGVNAQRITFTEVLQQALQQA